MPKTTKLIDISPHRSIMTKISQTGYTIQEALSELIDNSIDARIDDRKLRVAISISPTEIIITDNGVGMSEQETANAIRLGFSDKEQQLGEFGLGLKTSTSFLGRRFCLITRSLGGSDRFTLRYDADEWLENGSWFNYPLEVESGLATGEHGTEISIQALRVKITETLIENIRQEFGVRFGPFIKNRDLALVFNGQICEPIMPIVIDGQKTEVQFNFSGGKAWGWWGYQLGGLNKSYFGFHTYRRGRLVTTYDKIGLTPNQDIRQIIGELHIEGIPISHDKKSFAGTSTGYRELEQQLREYLKPFERQPKRILSGFPASAGRVTGNARHVNLFMRADIEKELAKVQPGDIIVTEMTRPQFLLGIRRSKGIITDLGGNLCHAAIVAREFGIPAVVGTQHATSVLQDGQKVILDGMGGHIYEY